MPPASSPDTNRPRRPLSAYNLFYRYKRAKIIEANAGGDGKDGCNDKEAIIQLVATPPGVETYPTHAMDMVSDKIRRSNIRLALEEQLFAKDTKNRVHSKSGHGYKMSFVEMNKIMVNTWKETDEFAKGVFQELADEAREEYQQRMNKYNDEKDAGKRSKLKSKERPVLKKPKIVFEPSRLAVVDPLPKERTLPPAAAPRLKPEMKDKDLPHSMNTRLGGSNIKFSLEPLPFEGQRRHPFMNGAANLPSNTPPDVLPNGSHGRTPFMPPFQELHHGTLGDRPLMGYSPQAQFTTEHLLEMRRIQLALAHHNRQLEMLKIYNAGRRVSMNSSVSSPGSYQDNVSPGGLGGDSQNSFLHPGLMSAVQPPPIYVSESSVTGGSSSSGSMQTSGSSDSRFQQVPSSQTWAPPPLRTLKRSATSDSESVEASVSSESSTPEDFLELIATLDLP